MRHQFGAFAGAAAAFGLSVAGASAGTFLYVDDDAPSGGNGQSWATAFRCLQDALGAAASMTAPVELHLAQGEYRPDLSDAAPGGTRDRSAAFQMRSGVTILGGFAGRTAGDLANQRDIEKYPSILSGDLNRDDGPNFVNSGENTYQIVVAVNVDDTAVLDGVIVRGARADGPAFGPAPDSREQGGAVNIYFASPRLVDCIFENNWMLNHGAVNDHGDTTLINCTFRNNYSQGFGAGLYIHNHSSTQAIGCRFLNNATPHEGGGAYTRSSGNPDGGHGGHDAAAERHLPARLIDCYFEGNSAERGAGFYNATGSASHTMNCTFVQNVASSLGGGLYCADQTVPTIEGCVFVGNSAFTGGGIYAKDALPTIHDCDFELNSAEFGDGGGGAWLENSPGEVFGCNFRDNRGFNGAGLYNGGEHCPVVRNCLFLRNLAINDNGGGMSNVTCAPLIENCQFIENQATTNSDNPFVVGGGLASYLGSPVVIGCYFRGNSAILGGGGMYQESNAADPPRVVNCIFEDNVGGDGGGLYNLRTTTEISGCSFRNNFADGAFATGEGAAIYNSFDCQVLIENCTVAANAADRGAGFSQYLSSARIRNSIFWSNAGGELASDDPAALSVTNSIVQGGWPGASATVLDVDPRMADLAGGDLRLLPGSPAIDFGDPDFVWADPEVGDLDGNPRIANCLVDLGAYEFTQPTHRGDVDLDGEFSMADIGPFIDAILGGGSAAARCRADANGDGVVSVGDIGDFVKLLVD